jgi:hypothetical protein
VRYTGVWWVGGVQLLIDHAMYTSQLGIQANGQDLSGSLIDSNGDKITNLPAGTLRLIPAQPSPAHNRHGTRTEHPSPGDTVGMIGKQDILHMSVVLRAAGIDSLDTPGTPICCYLYIYIYTLFMMFC